ncbi:unnamed protein product [Urochloa humidicola]
MSEGGIHISRVGSLLFTGTHETNGPSQSLPLVRTVVAVPSGWKLHIKVDLTVETRNDDQQQAVNNRDLNDIIFFTSRGKRTKPCRGRGGDHGFVEVKINWGGRTQQFPPQLSCPVEVVKEPTGRQTTTGPVYTIGDDAMSFTEFIMALRRILANYRQQHEDILDGHEFLNISSTREHPLLVKKTSGERSMWIHVKLKVAEAACTTLLMQPDSLYVHGFMNQDDTCCYGLCNEKEGECLLPKEHYDPNTTLGFDVSYGFLLGATQPESKLLEPRIDIQSQEHETWRRTPRLPNSL